MTKNKLVLLVGGLLCVLSVFSQQNNIRFKRITINDGLSLSSVYCIFQDSKGFMWFGTEDGLNKYDGKNFTVYRDNINKPNCISYKWIEQIIEDTNGNLWFGSRGGLTRFNPITETFTPFRGVEPNNQLSNDTITTFFEDKNKRLWVGSLKGINCINIDDGKLENIKYKNELNTRVNCFLLGDKYLWIATNNGLFYTNSENNVFHKLKLKNTSEQVKITSIVKEQDLLWLGTDQGLFSINENASNPNQKEYLTNTSIENISLDNSQNLWVVTNKALLKKESQTDQFTKIVKSFESTNSLSINTNKPILSCENNEIWFGTFGSGLFRINTSTNKKSHYKNNSADPQSLSENSINCIYEDRNGIIWIGTFGAGISIFDPQAHKFDLLKNNPLSENSLACNFIWSIWEDHNEDIWIGTNNQGISKYLVKQDSFIHIDIRKSKKHPYTAIRKVFEDSQNNIWIGSDGEGLFKYNPLSKEQVQFKNIEGDSTSLSNNSVRTIFEDSDGIIWIGTRDGFNQYHPKTKQFKQYKRKESNPSSISCNFIYSTIFEDSKGLLWIGTYGGGVNIFDKNTGQFNSFQYIQESTNSISDNVVFSIHEDKEGSIWLGTNNKLNRYNPKTKVFSHYGTDEGLPNDVIYSILPDKNDHLWLSTNNGICRFSTSDYSVKNFTINDGLQSKEFNGGAYHKGKSGKLYFGGVYGLNIIDPKKKFKDERNYELVFTKLEIHGNEVKVAPYNNIDSEKQIHYSNEDDTYYLKKNIAYTDAIELDYKHRFVTLEYSSLSSFASDKINYSYRLKGLEKKWINSGNRNYISYSNLPLGEYTFQVKAQNQNGMWSEYAKELKIKILPPFYLSWWFILLASILVSLLFIFIYRFLLHAKTNKLLTVQNEEIKSTNLQLQESERNLKELNATKDKFFRIISHDLKNPFTSLLSISEMIHENYEMVDDPEKRVGIRKIHESVKHIYTLLENLLTWSRSQTGKIDFHPETFDLNELVKQSICLYEASAEKKQIEIQFFDTKEKLTFADKHMSSSIIRNLINNAIKFSNQNSQIEIKIATKDKFVEFQIADEGIGIDKDNLSKLFRIDLKYKSVGTSGEKGTGLGLLLCKEFAEANRGKIWAESTIGKGSTFFFVLPESK